MSLIKSLSKYLICFSSSLFIAVIALEATGTQLYQKVEVGTAAPSKPSELIIFIVILVMVFLLFLKAYPYITDQVFSIIGQLNPKTKNRKIAFIGLLLVGFPTLIQLILFDTDGRLVTLMASISIVLTALSFTPILDWAFKKS